MRYGRVPYVEKPVSRLIYGGATPLLNSGGDGTELLDSMEALGINTIDTAAVYGLSEQSIGDWMEKRKNRDRINILTKGAHPLPDGTKRVTEEEIRKDLSRSLQRLRTDHVEMYLLHRDDPEVPVSLPVELLNEFHAKGWIGAFGGSNWTVRRIEEANEYAYRKGLLPFSLTSPNYSLAHQIADMWGGGSETLTGPEHREDRDKCRASGIPVFAHSALGHGFFSGKMHYEDRKRAGEFLDPFALRGYDAEENFERLRRCEILAREKGITVPEVAMSWLYAGDLDLYVVVTSMSAERMKQNISAMEHPLTLREARWLDLEEETR